MVVLQGDYAYVGVGPRLVVLNVSHPASPMLVGQSQPLPAPITSLAVSDDYAYVTSEDKRLHIIGISDPASPTEAGSYQIPGDALDVAIKGRYVYVAASEGGLRIIDVSDPASPTEIGSYSTSAWSLAVASSYAYIVSGDEGESRLQIIDISNPSKPTQTGFYPLQQTEYRVAVAANRAYITMGWNGLSIINVTNPRNPIREASFSTSYARDVAVADNFAYVAADYDGFHIVNVTHPASPAEASDYNTPGRALGVAVADNYAYVADGEGGLRIINVAERSSPVEIGFYDMSGLNLAVPVSRKSPFKPAKDDGFFIWRLINASDNSPPATSASESTSPNTSGWINNNVTVTLTSKSNSGGSEVKEVHYSINDSPEVAVSGTASSFVLSQEGPSAVTYFAMDSAGRREQEKSLTVRIDKTPPNVSASRYPEPNASGWNNTPVTVTFTATDSLSGIAGKSVETVVLSQEGANQSVSRTFSDRAGNSTSVSVSDINIDRTPPNLTFGPPSPAPNVAGWNNTDVSIPFSTSDNLSGVAKTDPPNSPLVLTTQGTVVSGTVTVTDLAGNSAVFNSPTMKIDKTPPTIVASRTPDANADGWNNTDVTVTYTISDSLSGLASISGPATFATDGANQSVIGMATDMAGNMAWTKVNNINIDKTPPNITGFVTPPPNANGWNNTAVTVTFVASDSLSGLATAPAPVVLTTDGAKQSVVGTAADKAGNSASYTVSNINIDKSKPFVDIVSPKVGLYLTSQNVEVGYAAADEFSGIDTVSATLDGEPVSKGDIIDFSKMAGNHTIIVTARDKAGNETTESAGFVVRIAATLSVEPNVIIPGAQTDKVNAYIEFPSDYDVNLIDTSTLGLTVNGTVLTPLSKSTRVGDHNANGIPDVMVQFDGNAFIKALGANQDGATVTIGGQLRDGRYFTGDAVVRRIAEGTTIRND